MREKLSGVVVVAVVVVGVVVEAVVEAVVEVVVEVRLLQMDFYAATYADSCSPPNGT